MDLQISVSFIDMFIAIIKPGAFIKPTHSQTTGAVKAPGNTRLLLDLRLGMVNEIACWKVCSVDGLALKLTKAAEVPAGARMLLDHSDGRADKIAFRKLRSADGLT